MENRTRSNLGAGLVLILLGLFLLLMQIPGFHALFNFDFTWPLIVIGVGVGLLVLGLIIRAPDMAIPACIVGGIGGILYWQNLTNRWETWSYLWTLIPGFVGIGMILSVAFGGKRKNLREGLETLATSAVLFIIFGAFLGNVFGNTLLAQYWPVLLILIGIYTLARNLILPQGRE